MALCVILYTNKSVVRRRVNNHRFHYGVLLKCLDLFFMRPSSLGGGRILRRTLSVRLSVCLSVRLSVRHVIITERHVAPPSELQ